MNVLRFGRLSSLLFAVSLVGVLASSARAERSKSSAEALISDEALHSQVADCLKPPAPQEDSGDLTVNGHALDAIQSSNVNWIARCVVPNLPGTATERAHTAALSTWWALREGVLDITGERSIRYSNCHERGKDRPRSNQPLYACPTPIWQVGMAASQVANFSDTQVRAAEDEIFGNLDERIHEDSILAWSASLAGFVEHTPEFEAIKRSEGKVRRSWLLRNPLIGIELVGKNDVVRECLKERKHWCFGHDYPSAKKFSVNSTAMNRSLRDLNAIFLRHL